MPDLLPPPPPRPANPRGIGFGKIVKWSLGVVALVIPLTLFGPVLMRPRRDRGATEAIVNARMIGLAFFEFQSDYGSFPNESTAAAVKRKTGSPLSLGGNASNDLFTQLLATGISQSEAMFYTKAKSTKKPDNVWTSDATALAHGECAYAYIGGVDAAANPATPLAFGPVIPGTRTLDVKSNDGKAVILCMDNSVISLPINSAGKIIRHGYDLLDPANPIWGGKVPDVRWPK